jgi:hypothetical protein
VTFDDIQLNRYNNFTLFYFFHLITLIALRSCTLFPRTVRPRTILIMFIILPFDSTPKCRVRFILEKTHGDRMSVCYLPEFLDCSNFYSLLLLTKKVKQE